MQMTIMNSGGDSKHAWDPSDEESTQQAREVYDLHIKDGFSAFRMNATGEAGEPMGEFDPMAGNVLLMPMMAGG